MKLSGIFNTDNPKTESGRVSPNTPAATQLINRQIRSLVPGQTLQGELVGRSGSEVQIKVSEDVVLNARLDRNMNLEVGQNMTFEVKNNGKALTLSPLFTNVATDANVLKALDMAALPINETTVSMTGQMMKAGLSINRNSLQQVFRELNSFPQAESSDIINLHKLGIPVNEDNVNQMISYRNLTHQLVNGMNDVFGALPEVWDTLLEKGDVEGAVRFFQGLIALAQEGAGENPTGVQTEGMAQSPGVPGDELLPGAAQENVEGSANAGTEGAVRSEAGIQPGVPAELPEQTPSPAKTPGTAAEGGEIPASRVLVTVEELPTGDGNAGASGKGTDVMPLQQLLGELTTMLGEIPGEGEGKALAQNLNRLQQLVQSGAEHSPEASALLKAVLGDKDVQWLAAWKLQSQWTLSPEEVAKKDAVENLYRKMDKQAKGLLKLMEDTGQTSQTAYRAAANLSRNIDFLQQLNQTYTYLQLPLKLQQGDAHGDLYVYTNKKSLARKDGQISALLHLDMESLGPVDVYVAMQNEKVSTKFYVQDDEMLDFLEAHMDILTDRLARRGYHCTFGMQIRGGDEDTENVVKQLLQQENQVPLAQYAFDVRA